MIRERLKEIYKDSGWSVPYIARKSGLPENAWKNALWSSARINSDIIEAANELWPQYVFWLVTGKTCPECGQISPEDERIRLAKKALDRDARKRNKKD